MTAGSSDDGGLPRRPYRLVVGARAWRRPLSVFLAVVALSLHPGVMAPVKAQANVPPGFLPPGHYPLRVLGAGAGDDAARDSSLVVSTEDEYTQTLNLPFQSIEVRLLSTLVPPQLLLKQLNVNGVSFTPPTPVVYRPLDAAGVVVPLQQWEWTLHSDAGGATLHQSSIVRLPELELRGGVATPVQRVDSTLTFGGTAGGTVMVSQWEAVGDPHYMRLRAEGTITVAGTDYPIDVAAFLGHTGLAFDL